MERGSDYNRGTGNAGRGRGHRGGGDRGGRGGIYPQRGGGRGRGGGGGRGKVWAGPSHSGVEPWVDRATGGQMGQGAGGANWPPLQQRETGDRLGVGPARPQPQPHSLPEQTLPDIQSFEISEQKPPLSLSGSVENRILPIRWPDAGGTLGADGEAGCFSFCFISYFNKVHPNLVNKMFFVWAGTPNRRP